jgi:hypothetical protein
MTRELLRCEFDRSQMEDGWCSSLATARRKIDSPPTTTRNWSNELLYLKTTHQCLEPDTKLETILPIRRYAAADSAICAIAVARALR